MYVTWLLDIYCSIKIYFQKNNIKQYEHHVDQSKQIYHVEFKYYLLIELGGIFY